MMRTMTPKKTMKTSTPTLKGNFLETSVFIKQLFGQDIHKTIIKKERENAKALSSHYVLMEYKRRVVKTLIDIYSVAKEEDSPSEVLKYFGESYSPRVPKFFLSALGELIKEEDISKNKKKFILKIENFIEATYNVFETLIQGFIENNTKCPLAKASIENGYAQFLQEIECQTQCSVENIWRKNKSNLKTLNALSSELPHSRNKGFQKPLPIIKEAIGNHNYPKKKTHCMKSGDFIIALEMPKHLRMLTFDKAFESLCGILKKEVYVFPSYTELKKESALISSII